MNKLYKRLGAIFLALAVFTVNVPTNTVHARDFIQTTTGDTDTDTEDGDGDGDDDDDDDDNSGGGNSGGDAEDGYFDEDGNDISPFPPVITMSVSAEDTGSSTTVFSDDSFSVKVSNTADTLNITYQWYKYADVGDDVEDNSTSGNELKLSGISPGTYKYYVIGTYKYYETNDPVTGTTDEKTATITSDMIEVTVIDRKDLGATLLPNTYSYPVGEQNLPAIYVELPSTIDFKDVSVEWKTDLTGGDEVDESDQNRFSFEPNKSISESTGNYTISADIYYDHDSDTGTTPAYMTTVGPLGIEIYDDSGIGIKISGETNYSYAATGTEVLTATLSGLTEADLVGGEYVWTVDGEEPSPNSTTKELSINVSALKSTQTYTVAATYIDKEGNTQTIKTSLTVTKGDTPSGDDGSGDSGSGDDDSNDNNNGSDGSYYPTISTDLSIASKVYVQYRAASPLEIEVDPRLDGTISYKWYVNKAYSTVGGTLLNYEYGIPTNTASIKPSVTPSTDTVGTFYYYCEVTNHFGDFTKTTRSNIATIQVIEDTTAATKYTVSSTGKLDVADYSKVVVDWSTFDEFIDDGGEVLYVTGAYIQNLRVPAVYSTNAYQVVVKDTGYDLEYTWKIKDGSKVSGYLDLALATTTSLSGVEKGNSALNYDARYSQIIQFKHEGALTTNDKGITLEMPTTVKDGDGHLNKINTDATIDFNTYVKGSIDNGILTVNMKECSDWVVSALKLAELTDYDNTNGTGAVTGFVNIPTFVGFEVSEFKNVVVGQMIYLDKINMDTIENNRFTGWYYDTAFIEPVSSTDVKNGMLVTREIVTNGLYPKYEKSNSYVPAINTPVPSTGFTGNEIIKLEALF